MGYNLCIQHLGLCCHVCPNLSAKSAETLCRLFEVSLILFVSEGRPWMIRIKMTSRQWLSYVVHEQMLAAHPRLRKKRITPIACLKLCFEKVKLFERRALHGMVLPKGFGLEDYCGGVFLI